MKQRPGKVCAIMLDTKGPEIRTGYLRDNEPVELKAQQEIDILIDDSLEGDDTRIICSYQSLPKTVKPGDKILIADGGLTCTVKDCFEDGVRVTCENDFTLGEKKNMNLPGCVVDLPTLTEQDEIDLVDFGLKKGIDLIAASFIRKAADIEHIRDVLGPRGGHIKIISKIENQEGL